jgi:hypothetical protein
MIESLNRFWQISVYDQYNGLVESRIHYLDPWYEIMASVIVKNLNYSVEEVTVEVMRTPLGKENTCKRRLDDLAGMIAYKGVGRKVLEATAADESGLWAGMILEGIKALRQARMFIWEREKIDPTPYLAIIEKDFRNSCIAFTIAENIQSITKPVQLQEHTRGDLLFSRYRYCFMLSRNLKKEITVGIADSFHEMILHLELIDTKITASSTKINRAPRKICYDVEHKGNCLKGKKFSPSAPGEWESELQGPDSCTHLADLAREAASSLDYWYTQQEKNKIRQEFTGGLK